MALFAISDIHLSLGTNKEMDVFGGKWENYTCKLFENWQKIVSPHDTVVIPGDVSWATYIEDAKADFNYIEKLNGRKIILKGNHDYWWTTKNKLDEFLVKNGYKTIEFLHNNSIFCENTFVCGTRGWTTPGKNASKEDLKIFEREKNRLVLSLSHAKKLNNDGCRVIAFIHYPPLDKFNPGNKDILNILKDFGVKECVYGHLHAKSFQKAPIGDFEGISLSLVSCDYVDLTPVKL